MNDIQRKIKQSKIVAVVLVFIGMIVYFAIPPEDHNCFDRIQNYDETGVDCGGKYCSPCLIPARPADVEDVKIEWVRAISDGPDNYDLVAKIINPNSNWGIKSVDYRFSVYDESNNLIGSETGSTYVMPDISEAVEYRQVEENNKLSDSIQIIKYIVKNDFETQDEPSKVTLSLNNTVWQEIEDLKKPNIYISGKESGYVIDGTAFYRASGVTNNESPYSFNRMNINVVLYDDLGRPIAAGTTNQWTVKSGEGWIVSFHWDYPIEERIFYLDYQIETNILDEENYIKEF